MAYDDLLARLRGDTQESVPEPVEPGAQNAEAPPGWRGVRDAALGLVATSGSPVETLARKVWADYSAPPNPAEPVQVPGSVPGRDVLKYLAGEAAQGNVPVPAYGLHTVFHGTPATWAAEEGAPLGQFRRSERRAAGGDPGWHEAQANTLDSRDDILIKEMKARADAMRAGGYGSLSDALKGKAIPQAEPEYLYHVTPAENDAAIGREGLRPDAPKISEDGPHGNTHAVFLGDEDAADTYRAFYGDETSTYRVKRDALRDLADDEHSEGRAWFTPHAIPPSALERRVGDQWVPVAREPT